MSFVCLTVLKMNTNEILITYFYSTGQAETNQSSDTFVFNPIINNTGVKNGESITFNLILNVYSSLYTNTFNISFDLFRFNNT